MIPSRGLGVDAAESTHILEKLPLYKEVVAAEKLQLNFALIERRPPMKHAIAVAILLLVAGTLLAQAPVKKDLMETLDRCPAPPASAKDAYTKIAVGKEKETLFPSAAKLFEPIESEVKAAETEYIEQTKTGAEVLGLSEEDAKKMSDPEMKRKMKKMSKEEKMRMGMEMAKNMPMGGPVTQMDPPPVRAALDEWQKVYNNTDKNFQRSVVEQEEQTKSNEEYEKAHEEIDQWKNDEINKLPEVAKPGEEAGPDPVMVKKVELKAADKHIALANKRLEKIGFDWKASNVRITATYSAFNEKLVAANYAADTKNFSSKKILSDGQMTLLNEIKEQIKRSRDAWEESASWQARRVYREKQAW